MKRASTTTIKYEQKSFQYGSVVDIIFLKGEWE